MVPSERRAAYCLKFAECLFHVQTTDCDYSKLLISAPWQVLGLRRVDTYSWVSSCISAYNANSFAVCDSAELAKAATVAGMHAGQTNLVSTSWRELHYKRPFQVIQLVFICADLHRVLRGSFRRVCGARLCGGGRHQRKPPPPRSARASRKMVCRLPSKGRDLLQSQRPCKQIRVDGGIFWFWKSSGCQSGPEGVWISCHLEVCGEVSRLFSCL